MLYFNCAEMGITGAPSAMVPMGKQNKIFYKSRFKPNNAPDEI